MSSYISNADLPFKYTNAAIIPINTIIYDFDTQAIESPGLALQISSLGTTGVLTPEWSSNEVAWVTGWSESATLGSASIATINAVGLYNVPKLARFMRLRMSTATTAGTTTISVTKSYADFRTATAAGTTVVSGTITASSTSGAAAHDAVISGNPVRTGGRAITANYTAVANGDVADIITTTVGAQVTKGFSIPELDWQFAGPAGGIINNTAVAARAAQAAGIRNYVTGLDVCNASGTVATEFVVLDGATIIWRGLLPVNSGTVDVCFNTPLRGTAATALNVQALTTGAQVYANLRGYGAP